MLFDLFVMLVLGKRDQSCSITLNLSCSTSIFGSGPMGRSCRWMGQSCDSLPTTSYSYPRKIGPTLRAKFKHPTYGTHLHSITVGSFSFLTSASQLHRFKPLQALPAHLQGAALMNSWGVEVPGDAAEQPESQTSKWLMRESISKGHKNM